MTRDFSPLIEWVLAGVCQKIEYNVLFMMIFIPVSNFGDHTLWNEMKVRIENGKGVFLCIGIWFQLENVNESTLN